MEPKGSLPRVDIEALMSDEKAAENFNIGVSAVKDLTWKNRLDYEACGKPRELPGAGRGRKRQRRGGGSPG